MASIQRQLQRTFRNNPKLNSRALQLKKSLDDVTNIVKKTEKKKK